MIKEIKIKDTKNGPVLIIENEFFLINPNSIIRCNEYLKTLRTNQEIKFESFKQYIDLLKTIANELEIPYSIETA